MATYFGRFLRESRLKAELGLRKFATIIDMKPSNLCNLEYGRIKPPRDPGVLTNIADSLGFEEGSTEWNNLFDLAAQGREGALPPDVQQYAATHEGVPVLLRTIRDTKLGAKQLKELTEFVKTKYTSETIESVDNS